MYNFTDSIEKGALQAAATGVLTFAVASKTPYVVMPIVNMVVPVWVFGATTGFAASLLNDVVHSYVKENIHLREKAQDEASMLIGAIVGAGTFLGVLGLMNTNYISELGLWSTLSIGSAGDLIGSFLYNQIRG